MRSAVGTNWTTDTSDGVQAQHPEHRAEQDDEDREDEASTEAHGEAQALGERGAPLRGAGTEDRPAAGGVVVGDQDHDARLAAVLSRKDVLARTAPGEATDQEQRAGEVAERGKRREGGDQRADWW